MHRIYLDNAATTPLISEVVDEMVGHMNKLYGNPSSIHAQGRESRSAIEKARRKIANFMKCTPSEIFFTSGGTEADNMAIFGAVNDLGIKRIITSRLEHHAVLHSVDYLVKRGLAEVHYVDFDAQGKISLEHLNELLKDDSKTLVSLMEANNEIGTITSLEDIGKICEQYGALFHSDTVQTMGHYGHDVKTQGVHFMACAAHKIHGPKGVGFIYIRNTIQINPFIHGGSQERNMRGGTENLLGILGLVVAFEKATKDREQHQRYIQGLKDHMMDRVLTEIPGTEINGSFGPNDSLYTVVNFSFPENEVGDMLLFNLDIEGISASGGSACTSGSEQGSHVLTALHKDPNRPAVRFSFSKMNTLEEIDETVDILKRLLVK